MRVNKQFWGVLAVVLLCAVVVRYIVNRPASSAGPNTTNGAIYYTGPMVPKSQAGTGTGAETPGTDAPGAGAPGAGTPAPRAPGP